jgi:hypothetical protein
MGVVRNATWQKTPYYAHAARCPSSHDIETFSTGITAPFTDQPVRFIREEIPDHLLQSGLARRRFQSSHLLDFSGFALSYHPIMRGPVSFLMPIHRHCPIAGH